MRLAVISNPTYWCIEDYWCIEGLSRCASNELRESVYYRQHCAQRKPASINLLRGRFWGFSPHRGDTLHRCGWNFARKRGPLLHAKFHPHRCNDKGVEPPKLKFLLRFDQNMEYKRPTGAYPLRDFHEICRVCTTFQDALGVKILLD